MDNTLTNTRLSLTFLDNAHTHRCKAGVIAEWPY